MATQRVKVYEDSKKSGLPLWAWLLPLLLILGLLAWYLTRHTTSSTAVATPVAPSAAPEAAPSLASVHFATDSADLTPDSQATLSQAASYMKQHPESHLRLEGYTDATGNDPHNMNLSQRRTQAVADYLKGRGVAGSRLTGDGFGPQNPVDTNATAAGKADNRRVEIFAQQ